MGRSVPVPEYVHFLALKLSKTRPMSKAIELGLRLLEIMERYLSSDEINRLLAGDISVLSKFGKERVVEKVVERPVYVVPPLAKEFATMLKERFSDQRRKERFIHEFGSGVYDILMKFLDIIISFDGKNIEIKEVESHGDGRHEKVIEKDDKDRAEVPEFIRDNPFVEIIRNRYRTS